MKAFIRGFKRAFCKGTTESSTEETGESTGRAVIAILNMMFGNIIFAMRSPLNDTNMTPQSEVVRDDPIGHTPPLSAQELCKLAKTEGLLKEGDDIPYLLPIVNEMLVGIGLCYPNLTSQSEVVKEVARNVLRNENIWRKPPLSPQELCKRAEDLWAEVRRTRFTDVGDEFPHMVAIMKLMFAVWTLLDRTNMTPEAMLWAYWDIRGALDQLGFTPEREQEVKEEDEERVADAQFLMDNGLRAE